MNRLAGVIGAKKSAVRCEKIRAKVRENPPISAKKSTRTRCGLHGKYTPNIDNVPLPCYNCREVKRMETRETVTKTHPIARMQQKDEALPLSALKLIDIYLARIDPNKRDEREVKFTLKEYCELLEIDRDPTAAKNRTFRMLSRQNAFLIPQKSGTWEIITLFERCYYENGVVTMKCTETAADYLFDWAKYGYIRYKLRYILRLHSRHAYNLYMHVLDNRFRGHWTVGVDELRRNVYHTDVPYYNAFKYFKRDILDKSVEEVNEITDARVSYTVNKSGRRIVSITFSAEVKEETGVLDTEPVQNLPEQFSPPLQLSFVSDEDPDDDPLAFFSDAVDDEFSRTELDAIRFRLADIIQDPHDLNGKWDYLRRTWQKVKIIAEKRPIADTHAYLLAVLDAEVEKK